MELKIWQLCVVCLLYSAAIPPAEAQTSSRSKAEAIFAVSDGANSFAKDLYNVLERRGNVILSPMSIFTAMSMTSAGAKGQTQAQILRALHTTPDSLYRNAGMAHLMASLKESDSPFVTMEMSNFMWVPRGVSIKPDFARNMQEVFQTKVRDADFSRTEEVRLLVNNRISNFTRGKIQELLPRGSITTQTRLLLANAVYFKGLWLQPFDERETRYEPFVSDSLNGRPSVVAMMRKSDIFRAALLDDLDAKALLMLYNDNRHGLLLLLPNRFDGLNELEDRYVKSGYTTSKIVRNLIHRGVNVTLPRFQIKYDTELSQSLQNLGITELFSENADLSGLSSLALRNRLKASGFFHQSTIEVNEGGSEASAASGMEITPLMGTSGYTGPIDFKADHPFMFFLIDELNGNVPLFMGRVTNPLARDSGRSRSQEFELPTSPYPNRNRFYTPATNDNTSKFTSRPNAGTYPTRTTRPPYPTLSDEIIFPQTENAYTPYHRFENSLRANNLVTDYDTSGKEFFGSISYPDEDDIESPLAKKKKREALPWAWPGPLPNQWVAVVAENETVEDRAKKDWHKQPLLTDLLIPLSDNGNQESRPQNRPSLNAVSNKPFYPNPPSSNPSFAAVGAAGQGPAGSGFPVQGSTSYGGFGNSGPSANFPFSAASKPTYVNEPNFSNDFSSTFPYPGFPPSQSNSGGPQPFVPLNLQPERVNSNLSPTAVIFPELALRLKPEKEGSTPSS